jgi:hypothetical protein
MGHRDLLVTHNLSKRRFQHCRHHPRGSVRRASGFVLTGNPHLIGLKEGLPTIREDIAIVFDIWPTVEVNRMAETAPSAFGR